MIDEFEIPVCGAAGCEEPADPRFYIHARNGGAVMACDGHGNPGCTGRPCSCPPPKPARGGRDLASRWAALLAAGRVRWMPGMLARCANVYKEHGWRLLTLRQCTSNDLVGASPDLSDPATMGCLLALAREGFGVTIYVAKDGEAWVVRCASQGPYPIDSRGHRVRIEARTEVGALFELLEAGLT